jgi:hypothetical protein
MGEGSMWSYYTLPYLEQVAAKARTSAQEDAAANYNWAHSGPYTRQQRDSTPGMRNIFLAESPLPVFRCPSAGLPEHQYNASTHNWIVMERSPASYLGSATGLIDNQNRLDPATAVKMAGLDGVLFSQSKIAIKHILDGTSNTMILGEALHDSDSVDKKGATQESALGSIKDHWAMGSDDIDGTGPATAARDPSEALGSTAVPINFQNQFLGVEGCVLGGQPLNGADCQRLQLAYGSAHSGGAMIARCDTSVDFITDGVDVVVWRDMATRDSDFIP